MIEFSRGAHVLFVCNASINRSPLAAAVFRAKMKALGIDCRVECAALMSETSGCGASSAWRGIEVARDYELRSHRSRYLGMDGVYGNDTIFIALDNDIATSVRRFPGVDGGRVHVLNDPYGVDDPISSGSRHAYAACFTQINAGVDNLIKSLELV